MRLGCNSWFWFFITLLPFSASAAVVQGQYNSSAITNTVNTVVEKKLIERGFSSNDPRYTSTLSSVTSKTNQIAKASKAVSVAGFTGRTWLTASLRSALFGRAAVVALVAAGAIEWLLQDEDNIQITTFEPGQDGGLAGYYWGATGRYTSTVTELANATCSAYQYCDHFVIQSYNADPSREDLRTVRFYLDAAGKSEWTNYTASRFTCSGNSTIASCLPDYVSGGKPVTKVVPVQEALQTLSEADLAKELNPQVVADIANNVWSQAANEPAYGGVPYSPSYAATSSDVVAATSTAPKPSVGDLVVPDGQFGSDTATNPTPDPNTGTGGDSTVIGKDPGIASPTLESPYTAQQIISPIENSMPFLRNLELPVKSATCPTYSFDWNGKNFVADVHCDLIEKYKSVIQIIASICWSLVALRMILSA
ncbi:hypothetical protein LLL26_004717 [Salmonella enterica]|nr:hypothetical protein [Salmonella enterica]